MLSPPWIFFQHFRRRAPLINRRKREANVQQHGNIGCNSSVLFDNPFSKPLQKVSVCAGQDDVDTSNSLRERKSYGLS